MSTSTGSISVPETIILSTGNTLHSSLVPTTASIGDYLVHNNLVGDPVLKQIEIPVSFSNTDKKSSNLKLYVRQANSSTSSSSVPLATATATANGTSGTASPRSTSFPDLLDDIKDMDPSTTEVTGM